MLTLRQCTCNEDWWIDQLMQWPFHFSGELRYCCGVWLSRRWDIAVVTAPVNIGTPHTWPCMLSSWPSFFSPATSLPAQDCQDNLPIIPDRRNCSSKLSIIMSGMHSAMHTTRTMQKFHTYFVRKLTVSPGNYNTWWWEPCHGNEIYCCDITQLFLLQYLSNSDISKCSMHRQ